MSKKLEQISQREVNKIPKLPKGEGSITLYNDGTKIRYRKILNGKRVDVYGMTVAEVFKKMKVKEQKSKKIDRIAKARILENELQQFIESKKNRLKKKSYDRIVTVFDHQIKGYAISKMRVTNIRSKDITEHLNTLNEEEYSYSTIKKTYDLLNGYFRKISESLEINPMNDVEMILRDNVLKDTKEISFLDDDEIQVFEELAIKTYNKGKSTEKPACIRAPFFVFVIYSGLRVGEAIALKWSDVDFEKKYVKVDKSLEFVENEQYDKSNPELMKKNNIRRYIYLLGTTKTSRIRYVPLPDTAIKMLNFIRKYSNYTDPEDYICANREGNHNDVSNMNRSLKAYMKQVHREMEKRGMKVDKDKVISMHCLRHTCASLYFRHTDLKIEEIAYNLGNSAEVCRSTYVHLVEERLAKGAVQINNFRFTNKGVEDPVNICSTDESKVSFTGIFPDMLMIYNTNMGYNKIYTVLGMEQNNDGYDLKIINNEGKTFQLKAEHSSEGEWKVLANLL